MIQHASRSARGLTALAIAVCAGLTACTPAPERQVSTSPTPSPAGASPTPSSSASSGPGALPSGFPAQLIPAMPGMKTLSGSVNTHGDFTDVGFSGSVTADPAAVDAFYASRFTGQGFKAPDPVTIAGVLTRTYVRSNGDETISLSAAAVNGGTTVTIGATVRAGSAK